MITYLKIDNFKSLNHTEIRFADFTVLVGSNAAGKSTILQAIDFLIRSCQEDFTVILKKWGYTVSDILSKYASSEDRTVSFISEWKLNIDRQERLLRWEMTVETSGDSIMRLQKEKIVDCSSGYTNHILLCYDAQSSNSLIVYDSEDKERTYASLNLSSSALKIAVDQHDGMIPELSALKSSLISSCSYDILSPAKMRLSTRKTVQSIGAFGQDLPAYLNGMPQYQKNRFQEKARLLLQPSHLEKVEAKEIETEGRLGGIKIEGTEVYDGKTVSFSSKSMSNGMLRLLALLAISETESHQTVMLLDEIENGINVCYIEKLIDILRKSCEEKNQQMILTTHSTVFLDYFVPEEIVFLKRNQKTGFTEAFKMLDISGIKNRLEYLHPGEILLNMSDRELIELQLSV